MSGGVNMLLYLIGIKYVSSVLCTQKAMSVGPRWPNVGTDVPTLGQRKPNLHCCLGKYDHGIAKGNDVTAVNPVISPLSGAKLRTVPDVKDKQQIQRFIWNFSIFSHIERYSYSPLFKLFLWSVVIHKCQNP